RSWPRLTPRSWFDDRMFPRASLVVLLLLPACSSRPPQTSPSNTAATTEAPAQPAAPCADDMPDAEMIESTLLSTEMTGLAEIIEAKALALDGTSPAPSTGLLNVHYQVRVLRWFVGTGPETMTLVQGAEAGWKPHAAGTLLLFSACASSGTPGAAY